MVFDKIKKAFSGSKGEGSAEDYLEIDLEKEQKDSKVLVKLFVLKKYDDVNAILNVLRLRKQQKLLKGILLDLEIIY